MVSWVLRRVGVVLWRRWRPGRPSVDGNGSDNLSETMGFPAFRAGVGRAAGFPELRKGGGPGGGGGAGSRSAGGGSRCAGRGVWRSVCGQRGMVRQRRGRAVGRRAAGGGRGSRSAPPARCGVWAGWGGQKKEQGQRPCSGGSGGDERLLSSCADGPPRPDQPDRCRRGAWWRARGREFHQLVRHDLMLQYFL